MYLHEITVSSWTDVILSWGALQCWLAVILALLGCSTAASFGEGSCECGTVPGFATMCCSRAEIFFLGIFLFLFIWSIIHSLIFYPVLYQRVVLDYRNDRLAKECKGRVTASEPIDTDDGVEYNLTIRYRRRGARYQIFCEGSTQHYHKGDKILLRILRAYDRSAIPAERLGQDFWPADSLRWSCPLITFVFFGGLPALLFYLNYPWPCFVFILTFSIPSSAVLSRRRMIDVSRQVFKNASPVAEEVYLQELVAEDDEDGEKDNEMENQKRAVI